MVETLARILLAAGERPAVLSRGYGRERSADLPVIVRDADAVRGTLAESGDEPLMLAERLDGAIVVVHPNRTRAGALAQTLGATVHVLDDGFQHLQLHRDIDIVMVASDDLSDDVFPSGRMREPIDALDHADAIVVIEEDSSERAKTAEALQVPDTRTFTASRVVAPPAPELRELPAFFVSGVANHGKALAAVRAAGWRVEADRGFKDHHQYTQADVESVSRAAAAANAAFVLTTAKDAVRLREHWKSVLPLHVAEMRIELYERAEFEQWLLARITEARSIRKEFRISVLRDGSRRAS